MWWIWLIVAVLAAIGEAVTYDLFLASISVSAVIVAVLAVFLGVGVLQVAIFAALSLVGIGFVRPVVKHALGIDSVAAVTGRPSHPHIVGKRAIVTQRVSATGGQIRIGEGEFWTARTYELDETIEPGESVEVVLVEGVTTLVERVTHPALESELDMTSTKGS